MLGKTIFQIFDQSIPVTSTIYIDLVLQPFPTITFNILYILKSALGIRVEMAHLFSR